MDSFLIALQFLTRVPVARHLEANDTTLGYSVLYYPLVGFLIGVILSTLALLLSDVAAALSAAILLTAWVWLTGGLHLDGLADCADATVGGMGDRQRSLRIMKDPSAGPIAVTVLLLTLLLKWVSLLEVIQQGKLLVLMLVPLLGRCSILLLMLSTPYISPKGLAERIVANLPFADARWVVVISLVFAGLMIGWANVLFAGIVLLWVRNMALIRLGGTTGDVYGAAVELTETAALLAVVLF